MKIFQYWGLNKDTGRKAGGFTWAGDSDEARQKLLSQQIIDVSVREISGRSIKRRMKLGSVSRRDVIFFLKQFSDLLHRGIMPDSALEIIKASSNNTTVEMAVSQMIVEIREQGRNFSSAFKDAALIFFPDVIPENFITIIDAGANAGPEGLLRSLGAVTSLIDKSEKLDRKIISAMVYPVFLIITSISIVIYLFSFTIPKIVDIFKDLSQTSLPLLTRGLLSFSSFMQDYWMLIVSGIVGLFVIYKALSATENAGRMIDRIRLSLPFFGIISRKRAISNFSTTLGILLQGGLDIIDSLEGTVNVNRNRIFNDSVCDIVNRVKHGESLCDSMKIHTEVFYSDIVSLVNVGEKIAELPSMLEHISQMYEDDIDYRISFLTTLLEPLIILVMGLVIGMTIIAVLTPLFQLSGMG